MSLYKVVVICVYNHAVLYSYIPNTSTYCVVLVIKVVWDMASLKPTRPQAQRRERRDRLFSTSDDTAMMKQIQATHAPDGREVDVRPIVQIVEEILIHSIAGSIEDGDLHV